jgi:hypothetical protein
MNLDDLTLNGWITVGLFIWVALLGLCAYLEYKREKDDGGEG